MTRDEHTVICRTREALHDAVSHGYGYGKTLLADGKTVLVRVAEHDNDRTLAQNRLYWGPLLGQIAKQAKSNGSYWTEDAWHEAFKRLFLGYRIQKVKVAGRKRPTVIRSLWSTRDLGVKRFSDYIDRIEAFAVTDLGVEFVFNPIERDEARHQPARRQRKERTEEATA